MEKDVLTLTSQTMGVHCIDMFQELDFPKGDAKILHLLDVLLKSPPPVLVYCDFKNEVAEIQTYLQTKQVRVGALHVELSKLVGGKMKKERKID